jgi:hypothetical protein
LTSGQRAIDLGKNRLFNAQIPVPPNATAIGRPRFGTDARSIDLDMPYSVLIERDQKKAFRIDIAGRALIDHVESNSPVGSISDHHFDGDVAPRDR